MADYGNSLPTVERDRSVRCALFTEVSIQFFILKANAYFNKPTFIHSQSHMPNHSVICRRQNKLHAKPAQSKTKPHVIAIVSRKNLRISCRKRLLKIKIKLMVTLLEGKQFKISYLIKADWGKIPFV
ncbi:hypothetical protein D917_01767 [Trichinella nativa]|uniref:Uncharacterized protein n=1 Tax=Trichinella nativa TaxID=6335 RepID=A0A1Y3EKU1_9BILA|nr:hypothetical protein D917_01767 [Trichinella nativa]